METLTKLFLGSPEANVGKSEFIRRTEGVKTGRKDVRISYMGGISSHQPSCPPTRFCQGKTAWVDQSCAECPGFPVLGAGDAPPPELHPGASECAPTLACAFMALRANSLICCPQLPCHPSKNGTCFCSTRGHTPILKFFSQSPRESPEKFRPRGPKSVRGNSFWKI